MDKLDFNKLEPARQHLPAAAPSSTRALAPSPSSTDELRQLKRLKAVTEAAKRLFESYPPREYENPETALATMVTVLNGFSLDVVERVTRPETGLQLTCVHAPRIAEIYAACHKVNDEFVRAARYRNFGSRNERPVEKQPRETRPSYAELKAKYGENWGIDTRAPSRNEPQAVPTILHVAEAYAGTDAASRLLAPIGKRQGRGGVLVEVKETEA